MGRTAAIVLLEVPEGVTVRIDLAPPVPAAHGRCGFQGVPPGFHRVEAVGRDLRAQGWVLVTGGETQARTCDASGLLLPTSRYRAAQVAGMRAEGELRLGEYPAPPNERWAELTAPLRPESFPPQLRQDPDGKGSHFLRALEGTHMGEWPSYLEELAWSFLLGHLDLDVSGRKRWTELLSATCGAGELSVGRNPDLFARLAVLLPAQMATLSAEQREPHLVAVRQLGTDLSRCEDAALRQAAAALQL